MNLRKDWWSFNIKSRRRQRDNKEVKDDCFEPL